MKAVYLGSSERNSGRSIMESHETMPDRRQFLAAGALGPSILLATAGQYVEQHARPRNLAPQMQGLEHMDHSGKMDHSMDHKRTLEVIERDNLILLANYWAAWPGMRLDRIGSYMADEIVWWKLGATAPIEGKEAVLKAIGEVLAPVKTTRIDVKLVSAIGNIVINERVDRFTRSDGEDLRHVTGFLLVKAHKIVEWRDYAMPKG